MSSVTVTPALHSKRLHIFKWLVLRIFMPHRYWSMCYQEELTAAIHPDFGWMWRATEAGGKALIAARDEGYRLGWDSALGHVPDVIREFNSQFPEYKAIYQAVTDQAFICYQKGSTEMLDKVVSDLKAYPRDGHPEIMREVRRLISEARIHPRDCGSRTWNGAICILPKHHLGPCSAPGGRQE